LNDTAQKRNKKIGLAFCTNCFWRHDV